MSSSSARPSLADGRWARRLIGLAIVLALGVLAWRDPASSGIFPACPLHAITGLHCPGCGSLRATHRLLNGDVAGAFRMNPLMIASLPFLGLLCLRPSWCYRTWLPWFVLATLVLYAVLRNIPLWPFQLLAPR